MPIQDTVNQQSIDAAFLWLLTFRTHADDLVLRAVNNLENVTSRGRTYHAFPFEIKLPPDDGQKPQNVSISFPNAGRELMRMVREFGPELKPQVTLELVLSNNPDVVEKTIDFLAVGSVQYDALVVEFGLIPTNIFARTTCSARYSQAEFPGLFFALR